MEILNSIWTVLITPNEFCKKLLVSPLGFIEVYIIMTFSLLVLNISTTKTHKSLYVIISSLITIISGIIIPSPFNVFVNYFSSFILILLLFKISPLKSLIALVCSVAIFSIISILVVNPYLRILHISSDQLSSIPIYNVGFLLTIYAIDFIAIFILKNKNLKINFLDDIDKKSKFIIFTNFAFGIFTIILQAFVILYYIDTLPIIITFLSCISLLVYYGISLYSLSKVMKLTLTTKKLESAEEYNNTLRILHDNVRGFKHDFDNIVTTIGGYVRTNDMEGLKNYYLQLEDDCQKVNNLYLLNPEVITNPRYLQLIN